MVPDCPDPPVEHFEGIAIFTPNPFKFKDQSFKRYHLSARQKSTVNLEFSPIMGRRFRALRKFFRILVSSSISGPSQLLSLIS